MSDKDNSFFIDQLFDRAQKGDENALTELTRLLNRRSTFVASKYLSSQQIISKIVNESFSRAWKKQKSFRDLINFDSYLTRITEEASIFHAQKLRPIQKSSTGKGDYAAPYQNDSAIESGTTFLIKKAIAHMGPIPVHTHNILFMYYNDLMSISTIAGIIGISKEKVRNRMIKALKSPPPECDNLDLS